MIIALGRLWAWMIGIVWEDRGFYKWLLIAFLVIAFLAVALTLLSLLLDFAIVTDDERRFNDLMNRAP